MKQVISNAKWIDMLTKTKGSWFRGRCLKDIVFTFFDKITQFDRRKDNAG
jgi:hypothetical protein